MKLRSALEQLELDLCVSQKGQRGKCKAVSPRPTFYEVAEMIQKRLVRDEDHTILQFKRLSDEQQADLKDIGSYVLGFFIEGLRRNENLKRRSAISLDVDELTPAQLDWILSGRSKIWKWPFIIHSTRKSSREFPRIRVLIPLSEPVTPDMYVALSRHVACYLLKTREESLDAVDEVSYRPAQVAYWPSVCKGEKFIYVVNDDSTGASEILDPESFLAEENPNWEDISTLPFSPKRTAGVVKRAKKAENPLNKPGLIGAWNRTYSVPQVIKRYLSDIYVVGDPHSAKPRYTYKRGTSANGAIVEDDGLFLYSHHSSDPCGEQLVNAWDLYRVHKFGDLDEGQGADTPTAKLPSQRAMEDFAREDTRVMAEMFRDQFDFEELAEDDGAEKPKKKVGVTTYSEIEDLVGDDAEIVEEEDEVDWMTTLDVTKNGTVRPTFYNYQRILANDPRFKRTFRWDVMAGATRVCRDIISKKKLFEGYRVMDDVEGDLITDPVKSIVKAIFTMPTGKGYSGYDFGSPGEGDIWNAIDMAATYYAFHPLKRRVEAVKWDGREHIDTFFIRHLKLEDTPFHREISRMFFLGGISRIYCPGEKWDYVYVLEGEQGCGKSTFFELLAMDKRYFDELTCDLTDAKQVLEETEGKFIMEIGELSAMSKVDAQAFKQFVTQKSDTARAAYDRKSTRRWRSYMIVGTTNEEAGYLKDPTGARRFITFRTPLTIKNKLDFAAVAEEAMQAWAEALVVFREMQADQGLKPNQPPPLYLSDAGIDVAAQNALLRKSEDPVDAVAEEISDWLDEPVLRSQLEGGFLAAGESDDLVLRCTTTVPTILREHFGQRAGLAGNLATRVNDIAAALRRLGWESTKAWPTPQRARVRGVDGKMIKTSVWVRKDATPKEIRYGFRVIEREDAKPKRARHEHDDIDDLV